MPNSKEEDDDNETTTDDTVRDEQRENSNVEQPETVGNRAEVDRPRQKALCRCTCTIYNSTRFSVRVMEALRSLQREDELMPTSSVEDIVQFIERNHRYCGDLHAQVRTALKQVCSQGFVVEYLENEYYLVGPVANSLKDRGDCPRFRGDEESRGRRRRAEEWRSRHEGSHETTCGCGESQRDRSRSRSASRPRRANLLQRSGNTRGTRERTREEDGSETTLPSYRINDRQASEETADEDQCTCEDQTGDGEGDDDDEVDEIDGVDEADRVNTVGRVDERNKDERAIENRLESAGDEDSRELMARSRRQRNDKHDKEFKNWIQRCRRECERRSRGMRRPNNK